MRANSSLNKHKIVPCVVGSLSGHKNAPVPIPLEERWGKYSSNEKIQKKATKKWRYQPGYFFCCATKIRGITRNYIEMCSFTFHLLLFADMEKKYTKITQFLYNGGIVGIWLRLIFCPISGRAKGENTQSQIPSLLRACARRRLLVFVCFSGYGTAITNPRKRSRT